MDFTYSYGFHGIYGKSMEFMKNLWNTWNLWNPWFLPDDTDSLCEVLPINLLRTLKCCILKLEYLVTSIILCRFYCDLRKAGWA
jgi:hypothetical protein